MDDLPATQPEPAAQPPPSSTPPPAGPSGAAARFERRQQAMLDALRTLVRDYALDRFGARCPEASEMPLSLRLRAMPRDGWALVADPPLGEQIQVQLEEHLAELGVFRRGRVYCFRCQSSDCGHGQPPNPLSVFRGYAPTGEPEWCELAQSLIEARDERVDQLFDTPPLLLARTQMGSALRARQLTPFGRSSRTYAILGQLVAGYLVLPSRLPGPGSWPDRIAMTLQVIEVRDLDGQTRLKLNPIVGGLTADQWDELLVLEQAEPLADAVGWLQRMLDALQMRAADARRDRQMAVARQAMRDVPALLSRTARRIEQSVRQNHRRTRHAQRHPRQERPVHKAQDDAREAAAENLYFDVKRNTWIVCGRQGRTHAFSLDGRHVTSFTVPPGSTEFRVRTERWRTTTPDELNQFRAHLPRQVSH